MKSFFSNLSKTSRWIHEKIMNKWSFSWETPTQSHAIGYWKFHIFFTLWRGEYSNFCIFSLLINSVHRLWFCSVSLPRRNENLNGKSKTKMLFYTFSLLIQYTEYNSAAFHCSGMNEMNENLNGVKVKRKCCFMTKS